MSYNECVAPLPVDAIKGLALVEKQDGGLGSSAVTVLPDEALRSEVFDNVAARNKALLVKVDELLQCRLQATIDDSRNELVFQKHHRASPLRKRRVGPIEQDRLLIVCVINAHLSVR